VEERREEERVEKCLEGNGFLCRKFRIPRAGITRSFFFDHELILRCCRTSESEVGGDARVMSSEKGFNRRSREFEGSSPRKPSNWKLIEQKQ